MLARAVQYVPLLLKGQTPPRCAKPPPLYCSMNVKLSQSTAALQQNVLKSWRRLLLWLTSMEPPVPAPSPRANGVLIRDMLLQPRWPKLLPPKEGNQATVGCRHEVCGCCEAMSTGLRLLDPFRQPAAKLCIAGIILRDMNAAGGLPLHCGSSMLCRFGGESTGTSFEYSVAVCVVSLISAPAEPQGTSLLTHKQLRSGTE